VADDSQVRVRPATPDDLPWLVALARDPATARALAVDAAERLEGELAASELVVFEADAGEPVGAARLTIRNRRSRIGEVQSLMLDPTVRGRGLGTASARAAARELVERRGMFRVEAEVYGFNAPALRAFAAAGYTREGVRRQAYDRHGTRHDGVLFGLLAAELH
jgi:RimJ/RimL family protein N-acetyltransferase